MKDERKGRTPNCCRRLSFYASLVGLMISLAAALPALAVGGKDAAWVAQRVRAWQPTEAEQRWQTIGWAGSILAAERLAKAHNRPVFLFTHDGRLNAGRC